MKNAYAVELLRFFSRNVRARFNDQSVISRFHRCIGRFLLRNRYYGTLDFASHRSCRVELAGDSVIFRKRLSRMWKGANRRTNLKRVNGIRQCWKKDDVAVISILFGDSSLFRCKMVSRPVTSMSHQFDERTDRHFY